MIYNIKDTHFRTKLLFIEKALKLRKELPGNALVNEEENIAKWMKSLLRITLHLPEDADLGLELNKRMELIAKLASGTPRRTFQLDKNGNGRWTKFYGVTAGHGRVDAFVNAYNNVLRSKQEQVNITSPIGFPPIYGIQNKYLLHYTGNSNSVTFRNIGLAVAAGAMIMDDKTNESTAHLENLFKLENLIYKFDIPNWKKTFVNETGKEFSIDKIKVQKGKVLFNNNCASCHNPVKVHNEYKNPLFEYPRSSEATIGTDSGLLNQISKPINPRTDEKSFPAQIYLNKLTNVTNAYFKKYNVSPDRQRELSFTYYRGNQWFRDSKLEFVNGSYVPRDLAGIWASAPYLHNDSVPTLWELLQKPEMRPTVFKIKEMKFDPVKVGLKDHQYNVLHCDPKNEDGPFWNPDQCVDTRIIGSSNKGHEFGTNLTIDEKVNLLEYLKVLEPYSAARAPSSTYEDLTLRTPFLTEFDKVDLRNLPLVGKMLEEKDLLRHRVRTLLKWIDKNPAQMFKELRDYRPIAFMSTIPIRNFSAENKGLVILSKHKDIIEVMDNPTIFSVRHVGYKLDPLGSYMLGTDMTEFNTVEKPWLRKLIPASDYPKINQMIKEYTEESFKIIENQQAQSKTIEMNIVRDLGRRVPSLLFKNYFGFSGPTLQTLYEGSYWIQYDSFLNPTNNKKVQQKAIKVETELLKKIKAHIKQVEIGLKKNNNKPINDTVLERMLLSDEVQTGKISRDRVAVNLIG